MERLGVAIYPPKLAPTVNWKHIDGPLMQRRDGTIKWLSLRERFMHWIGVWSLEDIERRPYNF